jgi:hypothetical protein
MSEHARPVRPELLHYRPWRGALRDPSGGPWLLAGLRAAWPIARTSLGNIFRRWLFWGLYSLALLVFLFFFFGQYLMAWAETQLGNFVRVPGRGQVPADVLLSILRTRLKLDGSGETFRNFIYFEGYMVMIVLALAGAVLIGNDLRFDSLSYYLSKPLSRWHYVLGKGLAVAVFVNLMTTLPALILWVEFGLLQDWNYFSETAHLALGILAYGAVLTVSLTLMLLATATALRKTVPLIMTWTTLFLFCRLLATALVERLNFDPRWRLIDLWNCTYVVGHYCLGLPPERVGRAQPDWPEAAVVLLGVSASCLTYLIWRIRAVEIVK